MTIAGEQMTFDILLNPSVRPEDETRLSRQGATMLSLFLTARDEGREVTTIELLEVGAQYNSRLYEIRRFLVAKGFCIDCVRRGERGVNFYRMVPLATSTFYARHRDTMERGTPW